MTDDNALRSSMVAYQDGDPAGFERLYHALAPLLRGYLSRLARDPVRVDDLLQETFLQLHRARRTYDPDRPVTPWAHAIARHAFLADCRSRRRRAEPQHGPFDETRMPCVASPEHQVLTRRAVRRALSCLPADNRATVLLHHVQGFSFDEIAARLQVAAPAARARASRGIARLRRALATG